MAKRWARKQTEEGAKEATATGSWLYSLFHNSNDPIAFADINGNLQTFNRAFEDMTGYSKNELVEQKTFMDITPKKYEAFEAEQVQRVIETGIPAEYEKEYIRKDGSHVPILLNVFQVENEVGELIGTGAIFKDLTERKKAESQVESLAKFPSENPSPIIRIAKDGDILYANEACRPLLSDWDCAIGQKAPHDWRKLTVEILKSRFTRRDIEIQRNSEILSFAGTPIDDTYVNFYGLNITERKQAEIELRQARDELEDQVEKRTAELKKSNTRLEKDIKRREIAEEKLASQETLYRTLVDTIPNIIWTADSEGKAGFFNRSWKDLTGREVEESLGDKWAESVHPDDIKGLLAKWERAYKHGEPYNVECRLKAKDGSYRTVTVIGTPVRDASGSIVNWVGINNDITERKETESALRESHGLLRSIAEGTSDAIYAKDAEHRYLFVNSVTAQALGYKEKDIIGRSDWELMPPELAPIIVENDNQIMKSGQLRALEEKVAERIWSVKKWPLQDDEGKTAGIIGISRDITETKRSQELGNALSQIDVVITSTLDVDEIMQGAIGKANQAMGTDAAIITEREEGEWLIKHLDGRLPQSLVGTRLSDEQLRGSVMAAQSRQAVVCNDAYHDERFNRDLLQHHGIRSFLVVPLLAKERVVGTFAFFHRDEAIPFSKAQIDFSSRVASSVSLAIENARLYSEQRSIADTLQETFLAVPDKIKGLDFGHLYRAATEGTKVGGDFFGLFELEENRVGLLVGDVSGKGLGAAKITSMIKNTIHAYAHEEDSPAEILKKTNRSTYRTIPQGAFATVFLVILDTTTGVFKYCNGGHPPPIIRRTGGRSSSLTTGNMPIGALEEVDYDDRKAKLKGDDVLFMYTDGLIEARRDAEFYGEKRLRKAVKELTSISASELPEIIFDKVAAFSNGKLADDVAILTVSLKRKGESNWESK